MRRSLRGVATGAQILFAARMRGAPPPVVRELERRLTPEKAYLSLAMLAQDLGPLADVGGLERVRAYLAVDAEPPPPAAT